MKNLYDYIKEGILDNADIAINNTDIITQNYNIVKDIINSPTGFGMGDFLENNNLLLDADNIKKIVMKLRKTLPKDVVFAKNKGSDPISEQIARNKVSFISITSYKTYRDSFYCIQLNFSEKMGKGYGSGYRVETIVQLDEEHLYAIDMPETQKILKELENYFNEYDIVDNIPNNGNWKKTSYLGYKYRKYKIKETKKVFNYNF